MRQDRQVHDLIRDKRDIERDSACCVRNDRSGCLQTSEEECSVSRESLSVSLPHSLYLTLLYSTYMRDLFRGQYVFLSIFVLSQSTLAVWVKWPRHHSTPQLEGKDRQYGSVCHQDPR